jgi:hypothetical protein
MYNFCTYFDQNYLLRGLTLYRSLARHARPFVLWVLCFDDRTYDALCQLDLPDLRPVSLQALEREDQALLATKEHRSQVEYYFTCTPSWILYVLKHFQADDIVTYLDADLFFYSSPQPVYEEMGEQSVLIVGHRFPQRLHAWEQYGTYNVGFLAFRNDSHGVDCLHWWRKRCLEWCYDRVEPGRFADQKYLDDWPVRFQQVVVLQHKGAGLAPWNLENYSLVPQDRHLLVDSQPLVFFHFHNFRQMDRWVYDPGLGRFGVQANSVAKQYIYAPYIRELSASARSLSGTIDLSRIGLASIRYGRPTVDNEGSLFRRSARNLRRRLLLSKRVYRGDLWLAIGGKVF